MQRPVRKPRTPSPVSERWERRPDETQEEFHARLRELARRERHADPLTTSSTEIDLEALGPKSTRK
jgi:hypothetical protein